MKRTLSLLLALVMVLSLAACIQVPAKKAAQAPTAAPILNLCL